MDMDLVKMQLASLEKAIKLLKLQGAQTDHLQKQFEQLARTVAYLESSFPNTEAPREKPEQDEI